MSSWQDLEDTYNNPNSTTSDKGMAIMSALPVVSKLGTLGRMYRAARKLGDINDAMQYLNQYK